jgi:HEAT repeat protein
MRSMLPSSRCLALILALLVSGTLLVVPSSFALTEEETKRAEALIPLLESGQEFWAIGEFVHMGPPVVPVLVKALNHPSRRVRLNAIESMYLIKDRSAVAALNTVAANSEELPAVREKALRVAIRLDPSNAVTALKQLSTDGNETLRNAVVNESRLVKDKSVIDLLIPLLADEKPSVADGAIRALYGFTGRRVDRQDFMQSTKEQRVAWAKDWELWWNENRDNFQFTDGPPARNVPPLSPVPDKRSPADDAPGGR